MSNFRTKPKIRIDFNSPDGNIYFILAAADIAMGNMVLEYDDGRKEIYNLFDAKEQIAALKAEFNNARSYDDALDIIRKYVDIAEC